MSGDEEKDPLPIEIDWKDEEGDEEATHKVAIIEEPGKISLGFSPEFPEGIVLYFHDSSCAIVFEKAAAQTLLRQMLGIVTMSGALDELSLLEEGGEAPKKPTLH